jgi:hypothetical protein
MERLLRALAYLLAHHEEIMLSVGAIVAATRLIPAATMATLERDWPRLANALRLLRAIGPDGVKAARVVAAIWTGHPWQPLPEPVEHPTREGESRR